MEAKIGKYEILSTLGEGGMARVYHVRSDVNKAEYAIKELYSKFVHVEEYRIRFLAEAETLKKLNHPNVIRIYKVVETANRLYMVMEYCDGMPLSSHIIEQSGPIPEVKANEIFSQILAAVGYFHQKDIIHRDIKPSNILIGTDMSVKIIDFGVAKAFDSKRTRVGAVLGTVTFMSPEQTKGLTIDNRTDIYSLGVTLFYMITGKPPYDLKTLSEYELMKKIINEPLPRMRDLYPFVSDHIQSIVDRATDKNMTRRFQDCRSFLDALNFREGSSETTDDLAKVTVGRDDSCNITVNDDKNSVSRFHAEITFDGIHYYLRDNSSNGTIIDNNQYVHRRCEIGPDSKIFLAGKVQLPWSKIEGCFDNSSRIPNHSSIHRNTKTEKEKSFFDLAICLLIPIIGWVRYYTWYNRHVKEAKLSGILSFIGFALYLFLTWLYYEYKPT
ncbi:MAG: FHA domain-containing serine/threonine-protein kinase [Cytophagales bacterium]|nr:FHA domain-containing serine/threonine-protein kinase [Cytophagales bacterium]